MPLMINVGLSRKQSENYNSHPDIMVRHRRAKT